MSTRKVKAFMIAGCHSGVGKTTIATAVMKALVDKGLTVQPFKAGPDYIDPTYHTWATGQHSRNLDTWLLPPQVVRELFHRTLKDKDFGVIEGVMGLYDGHSSMTDEGSSAELAKLLDVPVVLIVDAHGAARSLGAMVMGYQHFDERLLLAGVILNGVGSEGHYKMCREAIEGATGVRALGYMPQRDDLALPERHLGLIPTTEGPAAGDFLDRLAAQAEQTLDIEGLISIAGEVKQDQDARNLFPPEEVQPKVRIAVARDKAFSFYYEDSLDLLESRGAELAFFSPLRNAILPEDISGVYLGGGFPEMYANELAENTGMLESIRKAAQDCMPIYAECGGLMYLGRSTTDLDGRVYHMTGILPISTRLDNRRLTLGYRTVQALDDNPLLTRSQSVRGHEFHWSTLESGTAQRNAYRIVGAERLEGFHLGNVLASYVHLHLGSLPSMADRFVETCCQYRKDNNR